jgi:hypothetical protein
MSSSQVTVAVTMTLRTAKVTVRLFREINKCTRFVTKWKQNIRTRKRVCWSGLTEEYLVTE